MAHFKTLLFLSLFFTVVLVFSSKASADNEPGVAQTQGGAQVDHHRGEWCRRGGCGHKWCRRGECRRGWHHCRHYPYCREGAGGDETHQAETETKSGETESTNTNEHKP